MTAITTSVLDPNRPVLPEWTRWAWASMTEREYWLPLFDKVSKAREEIEWLTVIEGIRPGMYTFVRPDQLMTVGARAASHGLTAVPVTQVNRQSSDGYSSASGASGFDPSKPWEYRVLIVRPEVLSLVSNTPDIAHNNEVLGQVLGYPKCCREFFHRTWGAGQVDTTWEQYAETGNADGPIEANMLWRWKAIRWVSHLPCSFQCEATVEIGRKTREAAKKHGFVEEAKIIDAVLSWPVRWSGVNGIGEIVGPALKISTRTDWAPPTDKRYFHRKGVYSKPTEDIWKHNGFSSYTGMLESHAPILHELKTLAPENCAMLDLGCGNGRLLKTLKLNRPDIKIGGVDINESAITSAQSGLVGKWSAARIQDLTWVEWFQPDSTVVVSCPVRLTEMSEDEATATRAALDPYKLHLVYVYGDNLRKHPLQEWVEMAGFSVDRLTVICNESARDVAVGIIDMR